MLRKIWDFLDQFSGVVTTIGWVIMGVVFLIERLPIIIPKGKTRWLVVIIFLFLLFITIKFILSLIIKRFKKFSNQQLQAQVEDDIHKLEEKASKNKNKLVLPFTKQLKQWYNLSQRLAEEWSEDSREGTMNLFMDNIDERIKLGMDFYSNWKNQELTIYVGSGISTSKSELREHKEYKKNFRKPFFIRFSNWSWAVEKAYEKISDIIGTDWRLVLWSHYEMFHFDFTYEQNDVEKEIRFEFDGIILRCEKDGKEVKYKKEKGR